MKKNPIKTINQLSGRQIIMLTKFSNMGIVVSDTIHSYIKDGYHIDAKESAINNEKYKDCTFKIVLKRDVDGIECKTVISFTDKGDDKNKSYLYHKIDTVDDIIWSEETCTYNLSTAACALKEDISESVNRHANDYFYGNYAKTLDSKDKRSSVYKSLDDYINLDSENKDSYEEDDELEDSLSRFVRCIFCM